MIQDKVVTTTSTRSIPGSTTTAFIVGFMFAVVVVLAGCFESKTCGGVACRDQFYATVASADGSVPAGTHVLDVLMDGAMVSCTFQVPLTVLPSGGTVAPDCPPQLRVFVAQARTCTETDTGAAKTQTCVPVAGQFFEEITVSGKPAQLHIRLTVNGGVVLDRTETPNYQPQQPNGPGCEPTCHQAAAQWMFAAP